VDGLNPALSSRLLGPFESWRLFDAERQTHVQWALKALLERPDLSKNARDIITRTLA
jgi:aminopeptidase N